jgi:hypothetical protein
MLAYSLVWKQFRQFQGRVQSNEELELTIHEWREYLTYADTTSHSGAHVSLQLAKLLKQMGREDFIELDLDMLTLGRFLNFISRVLCGYRFFGEVLDEQAVLLMLLGVGRVLHRVVEQLSAATCSGQFQTSSR